MKIVTDLLNNTVQKSFPFPGEERKSKVCNNRHVRKTVVNRVQIPHSTDDTI